MCVMYHPDKHLDSKNKQVIKFTLVLAQVIFIAFHFLSNSFCCNSKNGLFRELSSFPSLGLAALWANDWAVADKRWN